MAVVLRCLSGKNITIIVWHIKNGVFVSPSRMEAESYGVRDKIHSKRVALTDVAWIDAGQGQYAKVDDAKFSTKDSEGKTLTPEQQEYFKDSKVRDADGNLLVMYHGGADETYTVFDRKKSKYSNLYGRGFYFTSAKTHSSQYGTVRSFYLNIKKPLSNDETTIKKSDLLKFVKAVAENDDYGIENYGYGATPESVTDAVYGKSDFAMLQDINAACIGDMVEAVEYFNSVIGTDYDGFILPTETVAFDSAQIKNIDNTNPTDSEDVRYSEKWIPKMSKSELRHIENIAKNELNSTDNYIDNITKWLYNDSKGKHLFALYSTEDENNPTILYASNDNQAKKEYEFLKEFIYAIEEGDIYADKQTTFDEILKRVRGSNVNDTLDSRNAMGRRLNNGIASVHSRKSKSRLSPALRNCLQDCWQRRLAEQVEENKYSAKYDYVIDNNFAVMTRERILREIEDSSAGTNKAYARRYITTISPTDYLNLTTGTRTREFFDEKIGGDYGNKMGEYDYDSELAQNKMTPYLMIDLDNKRVIGHDGRHRMRALEKKGIDSVEIVVEFYNQYGMVKYPNGYDGVAEAIRFLNVIPQDFKYLDDDVIDAIEEEYEKDSIEYNDAVKIARIKNSINNPNTRITAVTLEDVMPLNRNYQDRILATYGEDANKEASVKHSQKETPRDILLSTFSGLAQNDIEQKYLDDYRKNITELV